MPRAVSVMGLERTGSFGSAEHRYSTASRPRNSKIIQTHARATIERISQRGAAFSAPLPTAANEAVTDWLDRHEPVGPEGERLSRASANMVATPALVLAKARSRPVDQDWRDAGEVLESQGHPQEAFDYVTRSTQGRSSAYTPAAFESRYGAADARRLHRTARGLKLGYSPRGSSTEAAWR